MVNTTLGYLLKIAYRNLFRNKRRSALCIVAIFIAITSIIFMRSYIAGAFESFEVTSQLYQTGHLRLFSTDYEDMLNFDIVQYPIEAEPDIDGLIEEVKQVDGVAVVFKRIRTNITVNDPKVKHASIWGIDFENESAFHDFNPAEKNDGLIEGEFPRADKNECIIGHQLAKRLGLKVGDKIEYMARNSEFSDKIVRTKITGIFNFNFNAIDRSVIIMPIGRLERILYLKNRAQFLFVYTEDMEKLSQIKSDITGLVKERNINVMSWLDNNSMVYTMELGRIIYFIIYCVFMVVASFLIVNTIIMMIYERMKEVGMMGALGMTRFEIVMVFLIEAVYLSIIGSFVGALSGGIITFLMSQTPINISQLAGNSDMPMSNLIYFHFSIPAILWGFLFGVAVAGLCTLLPSLKVAFIEPVEALRR